MAPNINRSEQSGVIRSLSYSSSENDDLLDLAIMDNSSTKLPHLMSCGSDEEDDGEDDLSDNEFDFTELTASKNKRNYVKMLPEVFKFELKKRNSHSSKEKDEDVELMTITVLDGDVDSKIEPALVQVSENVRVLTSKSLRASQEALNMAAAASQASEADSLQLLKDSPKNSPQSVTSLNRHFDESGLLTSGKPLPIIRAQSDPYSSRNKLIRHRRAISLQSRFNFDDSSSHHSHVSFEHPSRVPHNVSRSQHKRAASAGNYIYRGGNNPQFAFTPQDNHVLKPRLHTFNHYLDFYRSQSPEASHRKTRSWSAVPLPVVEEVYANQYPENTSSPKPTTVYKMSASVSSVSTLSSCSAAPYTGASTSTMFVPPGLLLGSNNTKSSMSTSTGTHITRSPAILKENEPYCDGPNHFPSSVRISPGEYKSNVIVNNGQSEMAKHHSSHFHSPTQKKSAESHSKQPYSQKKQQHNNTRQGSQATSNGITPQNIIQNKSKLGTNLNKGLITNLSSAFKNFKYRKMSNNHSHCACVLM